MPDAPIMIVRYGLTAMLAAMGGKDRASSRPLMAKPMAVKTVFDTVPALQLAKEEWRTNQAL
jgi:hypothetical protein